MAARGLAPVESVSAAIADVRTAVVKGGGKMADSGSVLFNFQRRGEIYVQGSAATEEEVKSPAPHGEVPNGVPIYHITIIRRLESSQAGAPAGA